MNATSITPPGKSSRVVSGSNSAVISIQERKKANGQRKIQGTTPAARLKDYRPSTSREFRHSIPSLKMPLGAEGAAPGSYLMEDRKSQPREVELLT